MFEQLQNQWTEFSCDFIYLFVSKPRLSCKRTGRKWRREFRQLKPWSGSRSNSEEPLEHYNVNAAAFDRRTTGLSSGKAWHMFHRDSEAASNTAGTLPRNKKAFCWIGSRGKKTVSCRFRRWPNGNGGMHGCTLFPSYVWTDMYRADE